MALILNIDTATEMASICLSKDGEELILLKNSDQKDHASWVHVAIEKAVADSRHALIDLEAIAVTAGPGSYTGLRVGMATAKGFCFALKIPLITESTLTLMAFAAQNQGKDLVQLLCPMIDARRMEVFTALYTMDLQIKMPAVALLLDESSFSDELAEHAVLFFGSGCKKWRSIVPIHNAFFADVPFHAGQLGLLSEKKFVRVQFTDIVYSEPVYLKEFYTHTKK